jgi:hypothetical protein
MRARTGLIARNRCAAPGTATKHLRKGRAVCAGLGGTQLAADGGVTLPEDLEAIVAADEEGRARLTALEEEARARADAARQAEEARRARVAAERRRSLDAEIARIEAEAAREGEARVARRKAWLDERRRRDETLLEAGIAVWMRVVRARGGPGGEEEGEP